MRYRKGIILAGGKGTRLAPITSVLSKQLLPLYDKPMIYYPLSTLMLCGIRDILIITSPSMKNLYQDLLGDGKHWGLNLFFEIQEKPQGIAQSILIGEEFLATSPVVIALGDNLFHGNDLIDLLQSANDRTKGATIFAYSVNDPENYGVLDFNNSGNIINIEEKPKKPKSSFVVTGLYFYDNSVIEKAKKINFSPRGELEITSINNQYLNESLLNVEMMGRGYTWLDTGTFESLHAASSYVQTLENRQGLKIGCPEEVAWRKGWINNRQLTELAIPYENSSYGQYLLSLLKNTQYYF